MHTDMDWFTTNLRPYDDVLNTHTHTHTHTHFFLHTHGTAYLV